MRPLFRPLIPLLFFACASHSSSIRTIQAFRAAQDRSDDAAVHSYLAPDARMWFEKREGPGLLLGKAEPWRHWDLHFPGHSTFRDCTQTCTHVPPIRSE